MSIKLVLALNFAVNKILAKLLTGSVLKNFPKVAYIEINSNK